MTPLERRYRRMLRLLPGYYRRVREDDMVATFLNRTAPEDPEDAEFTAEHGWPSGADLAQVAMLALRLRLGGPGASPRHRALGAALRRVALLGLLAQGVHALVSTGLLVWFTLRPPSLATPGADVQLSVAAGWYPVLTALGLFWVPAYVVAARGHRRLAWALSLTALVPSLVWAAQAAGLGGGVQLFANLCWLLTMVVPVLALAAFHPDAPPVRARPWLVALPVGVVSMVLLTLIQSQSPRSWAWIDQPGLASMLICAAGLACLLGARGVSGPSWTVALAVIAGGVLGLRVVTLASHVSLGAGSGMLQALITAGVVQAGLTLAVATALVVRARRQLRALPGETGARGAEISG